MPKRIEFEGVVHEFPDDFTDEEIAAALGGATPPPQAPGASLATRATNALPMVGSLVGSLVGGRVGAPALGAGLGGAAGEGYKSLAQNIGQIPGAAADVARNLVTEPVATLQGFGQGALEGAAGAAFTGAVQGAMDKGAGYVGAGFRKVAPKLADLALNPIESVAKKYPNIAETYVKVGKLISPGRRGGVGAVGKKESVQQARALTSQARQKGDAVIAAADQAGASPAGGWPATLELQAMRPGARTVAKSGGVNNDPAIVERINAFMRNNPRMTNTEANRMVRELDDITDKAHKAARAGNAPVGINEEMNTAVAGGLRGQIRRNVPDVVPIKQETRDLAGLTKALDKASVRKHLLTRNLGLTSGAIGVGTGLMSGDPGAGLGAGVGTLGAYYAATNPRNLGRMALAARNMAPAAEMTPQMLRLAALLSALGNTEPAGP